MMQNWKAILWILGAGVAASLAIVWVVYFNAPEPAAQPPAQSLGQGSNLVPVLPGGESTSGELPVIASGAEADVFKIHNGPIAGATLWESVRPTTTMARFMLQTNGHAFDVALDSPGAVPKALSNTTIPGIAEIAWAPGGRVAVARYIDGASVKTASFTFPIPNSPTTTPVRVQFLPADIASLALSPDGSRAAYILRTAAGADGYVADANGGGARKLFSLPLSQVSLSWPAAGSMLAVSAPAAGVGGIAFSINASTGAAAPLLFAEGLTATANRTFSHVVYQTAGAAKTTYAYDTAAGQSRALSFDPLPEQCVWGKTLLFCAIAMDETGPAHIDLFHQGLVSAKSGIAAFNPATGRSALVALPGTGGSEEADIAALALSPDEKYLIYIRKGDRSLWGVRIK